MSVPSSPQGPPGRAPDSKVPPPSCCSSCSYFLLLGGSPEPWGARNLGCTPERTMGRPTAWTALWRPCSRGPRAHCHGPQWGSLQSGMGPLSHPGSEEPESMGWGAWLRSSRFLPGWGSQFNACWCWLLPLPGSSTLGGFQRLLSGKTGGGVVMRVDHLGAAWRALNAPSCSSCIAGRGG